MTIAGHAASFRGLTDLVFQTVRNGSRDALTYLLDGGADVNIPDGDGNTPLNIAARCANIELATLLLDRGADLEAKTERGYTPIGFAETEEMRAFLRSRGARD